MSYLPIRRKKPAGLFVAVLRADIADEGPRLVIAPMVVRSAMPEARGRLFPLVSTTGVSSLLIVPLVSSFAKTQLRQAVRSIAGYRDDITGALDWLFTGV